MMQLIQMSLFDLRIIASCSYYSKVFIKGKERPDASSVVVALQVNRGKRQWEKEE